MKCEFPVHVQDPKGGPPREIGCDAVAFHSINFGNNDRRFYCERHFKQILDMEKKLKAEARRRATRGPMTEGEKQAQARAEEKRQRRRERNLKRVEH